MKKSLGQPASQVNLTSHPCKGSFDEFKVSGQWYYRGFITLRIINEVVNANVSRMLVSERFQIDTFGNTDRPPKYPVGNSKAELWHDAGEWSETEEPAM